MWDVHWSLSHIKEFNQIIYSKNSHKHLFKKRTRYILFAYCTRSDCTQNMYLYIFHSRRTVEQNVYDIFQAPSQNTKMQFYTRCNAATA